MVEFVRINWINNKNRRKRIFVYWCSARAATIDELYEKREVRRYEIWVAYYLYSHYFLFRHDLMQFSGSSWPSVLLTAATIKRPNLLFSAFSNGVFIVFDLAGFTLLQNFRFDGLKFNYHIDTSFFQKEQTREKISGNYALYYYTTLRLYLPV